MQYSISFKEVIMTTITVQKELQMAWNTMDITAMERLVQWIDTNDCPIDNELVEDARTILYCCNNSEVECC
jgi:hypothetical protein